MSVAAHLAPDAADLRRLRHVILGRAEADLVVKNVQLLALPTREIVPCQVVVSGAFVAGIAPLEHSFGAKTVVDGAGRFLAPGFIDTHIHIEYSLVTPGEFARCVVPRGTTCVLADPNCVGNVLGARAMQWAGITQTPLKILQQISHRIPRAPQLELGGAVVEEAEQLDMLATPQAVGAGESVPFGFDQRAADLQARTLQLGKRNTGHSARVSGPALWAYAATGVGDDHNAYTPPELWERLRLGMMITVMAGSMNDNVPETFADAAQYQACYDRFSFCADDKHVNDLAESGHIDHHVRQAISCGVPELEAYAMASFYAAQYYRLDHVMGAVLPGRRADFMLLDSLAEVAPSCVWIDGQLVAEKKQNQKPDQKQQSTQESLLYFDNHDSKPDWLYDTMHLAADFDERMFRVPVTAEPGDIAEVRAMEMYDGYFKRAITAELPIVDDSVCADPDQDIAKVTVIDRHHATDTAASGFVRGFALQRGALAATTNCENQNLVVLGSNDADMACAALALQDSGGGYAVVCDGEVQALLALPLAGIMSDTSWEDTAAQSTLVNQAARALGCQLDAPFMIMAFIGLAGVPDYGLTEKGFIDAASQQFIPVVQCCRCPAHVHDQTTSP